ncbi:MAG: type IV pilus biogenesis protein PilM [Phycisphaerae bacterium]
MAGITDKLRGMLGGSRVVAVDFDMRRLRVVESGRTAGAAVVRRLHSAEIPDDVDVNVAESVGAFIGRTLKELHLGGAGLLMNVPRGQAVLKPLTFPPGTDEAELPGMVLFQMESELPFAVSDSVIDFTVETHYAAEPVGGDEPESVDVLVAAVRLAIVDYYRRVALAAGSKLLGLGLRPYSNLRCLQSCLPAGEEEAASVALVNLTADETEIDVLTGGAHKRLAFSRSTAPGGGDDEESRVRAVVTEAARSLRSFQTLDRGGRIDSVLVAGSTGLEQQVAEALARRLGVPAERFDPSDVLGLTGGVDASEFVAAIGLAGAGEPGPLNFLAPKRPVVKRNRRRIATVAVAIAAAALLIGVFVAGWLDLRAARGELRKLERTLRDNKPHIEDIEELSDRVDQLDSWRKAGRDWLVHWTHVSCLLPSCTELYVTSVRTAADGRMGLEVRARRGEVIDQLRQSLTQAGYEFESSGVSTTQDEHGYNYTATVHVRIPADMEVDLSSIRPVPRPSDDMAAGGTP